MFLDMQQVKRFVNTCLCKLMHDFVHICFSVSECTGKFNHVLISLTLLMQNSLHVSLCIFRDIKFYKRAISHVINYA